ncbi:hypothetical protein UR09_01490 [Candidatus Nitromaritima sp. SCGC AAA799-A02]|nr:hypothetical protein UR09_01490 [Candidatus Nitromaritima sp. SCGC AAA799-A02]
MNRQPKKAFKGFPKELFKFLSELSKNNNREWFNANKERYRSDVVAPIGEFITAMGTRLQKIADGYVADPRPNGGSMFRIYRDIRFSKDKRPYKEHVGCQFRHRLGKDAHAPGFYVHIAPGEVFFGGGIWRPSNPALHEIRTTIVANPKLWKKVVENKALVKRFGGIGGEGLKRPPRGFDPGHPYIEDLKRKTFFVIQSVDPSLALAPKFINEVEKAFSASGPLMQFIVKALGLPRAKK